ncbi:MAG: steroid delta-isomerase [Halioglobus sp.]|jgi:steroid delta-isomerase
MSKELVHAQIDSVPWSAPRQSIASSIAAYFNSYPLKSSEDAVLRADLFADDFSLEDPVGAEPITDKDALIQFFNFPFDLGISIEMRSKQIIITGDEAISLTTSSIGVAGQEPAILNIVHNFTFAEDGKISGVRIFFDKDCVL